MVYKLNDQDVFFVVRRRENVKMDLLERPLEKPAGSNSNVQVDWEGHFTNYKARTDYPDTIRMVQIWDNEEQQYIELLTNNFTCTASTIEELYKRRWIIESFFKEIKTHLKIKSFVGTSMNAVLIQIWTALITILLLKTLQRTSSYKWHLSNLIAVMRLNLFVKIDLQKWLDKPFLDDDEIEKNDPQQMSLF
jgi:IS4 transposase